MEIGNDPLGVLGSTWRIVEAAQSVRIDREKVDEVAAELAALHAEPPAWNDELHFRDGSWRTAGWVLALDALNFCFWSEDPDRRWRVEYQGQRYDGYWALAAALKRAVDAGKPLWDAAYLAEISTDDVADILRPIDHNTPVIPLFYERVAHLRELGHGLLAAYPDEEPVAALFRDAGGSVQRLIELVVELFPSFNDRVTVDGREIRFYKRAQILVADLQGAFGCEGLGSFSDLDILTAFADYKVPQVLRRFGVLVYDDHLAATIDRRQLLPAGSIEEIEIRASTIWACEFIRRSLAVLGKPLRAFEIDWALWLVGQSLPPDTHPYHRTLTIFY
jgi:hypothetical protein